MQEASDQSVKRHYWVAALLGLLGVGLGYFYAGRSRIGVAIWMLAIALPFSVMHFFGQYLAGVYAAIASAVILTAILYFGPFFIIAKNRTLALEQRPKRWHYAVWVIVAVVLGNVWVMTMRSQADYRLYNIPAGSMAPNVMLGDVVVARQFQDEAQKASLAPGAVVIFLNRKDADELGRPQEYVKRVIGTGGQTVQFSGGAIFVDGAQLPQEAVGVRKVIQYGGMEESILHMREHHGEHSYLVLDAVPDGGPLDNIGPYQVPESHYFMVGDNRDRSQDSRVISRVGYVSADDVVGEALYVAFSTKDLSRIGKRLDD